MAVGSVSMSLIVLPVAVVDITISMDQSALSISLIVGPVTLVHGAVRPDLDAFTLSNLLTTKPVSFIACSVLENNHFALLPDTKLLLKGDIIVAERSELLSHFLET